MNASIDASALPAGTQVRTRSADWVATTDPSELRWRSTEGGRTASDTLVTDWLDSGIARLIAERGRP